MKIAVSWNVITRLLEFTVLGKPVDSDILGKTTTIWPYGITSL